MLSVEDEARERGYAMMLGRADAKSGSPRRPSRRAGSPRRNPSPGRLRANHGQPVTTDQEGAPGQAGRALRMHRTRDVGPQPPNQSMSTGSFARSEDSTTGETFPFR